MKLNPINGNNAMSLLNIFECIPQPQEKTVIEGYLVSFTDRCSKYSKFRLNFFRHIPFVNDEN